jgi:hypothetical protein
MLIEWAGERLGEYAHSFAGGVGVTVFFFLMIL